MTITPRIRLGPYEILSPLGAGGMGEVYLAQDTRLGRNVALKLLPKEFTQHRDRVARFEQEARAASALNHPNIITIHDIGAAEVGRFIVMELVEGRTLREVIAQGCALDALIPVGGQIAKALSVAHAAGITHRDIKPENIMVREDSLVKVLDFGLTRLRHTKAAGADASTLSGTAPGLLVGSVRYMSPEQARGEPVSQASDVFSLGLVFYEMATGRHPFMADSLLAILHAITSQQPPPPSHFNSAIPTPLEALIRRMLQKDARLRPRAREVEATLAAIGLDADAAPRRHAEALTGASLLAGAAPPFRTTVGRERERVELRACFAGAAAGRGWLAAVAGEPGIGKTTLVEDFLRELSASGQPYLVGRGRCSERLAGTEAYLPWLEALESLLRSERDPLQSPNSKPLERFISETMKGLAPTWYAQVSSLPGDSSAEGQLTERASSQERMKRELRALFQAISQRHPVVLFFDDLHWADASTIDLLAFLADRFDGLRVLIVATYRPSDLLLAKHPFLRLKPDLQARGVCREIALEFLSREEIAQYMALEFPEHRFSGQLPALIHAKTEGSPLFMVDLVRYLRDRRVIAEEQGHWVLLESLPEVERELPESVRGMIERKVAQLGEEDLRLLVAASVQGYEFDSAVVGRVLEVETDEVEQRLEALERVHAFVRAVEERELPDDTLTVHYRFVHVLYQNALYGSLRPTRKVTLSRGVAEALLSYYGEKSGAVASELATLLEGAREYARAAEYFLLAATNAAHVSAYKETMALVERGRELLKRLPDTLQRRQQELEFLITLGPALSTVRGYAVQEVVETYNRALELCQQVGEERQLFTVLYNIWLIHDLRGEQKEARQLAERCLELAESAQDSALLVLACTSLGETLWLSGEFLAARPPLERALSLYDPIQHHSLAVLHGGYDAGMFCNINAAHMLWHLGYPDQALQRMREAITLAQSFTDPYSLAITWCHAALVHRLRGEREAARERAEATLVLSGEQGFPFWEAYATILLGWVGVEEGNAEQGLSQIYRGISGYRATGSGGERPYFAVAVAEACVKLGRMREGLDALAETQAFVDKNGLCFHEAELHRLRGELLLRSAAQDSLPEAETCIHSAIDTARRQSAKSLELRGVMSLSRLWERQGKGEEAREMLAGIYDWFSEGFETADLKEAKALLEELSWVGGHEVG